MKDFVFVLLDWCGEHEALLTAVAGFISSVVIVKITSGLDLRKSLCVRRFETYEKAIAHLSHKLSVYYRIQAIFESLKEPVLTIEIMKSRVAILVSLFVKLGDIEKEDSNITGVTLYTVFPVYDMKPLAKELTYFCSRLDEFSCWVNLPGAQERLKQFAPVFIEDVERIIPMVEKETDHLNTIYAQLKNEIAKDKMMKKLFRKS